jgi:hypothetical protein
MLLDQVVPDGREDQLRVFDLKVGARPRFFRPCCNIHGHSGVHEVHVNIRRDYPTAGALARLHLAVQTAGKMVMVTLCKQCTRANPTEATYCYFDGVSLRSSRLEGPVDVAQAPFPSPFVFPSGEACENFDQLALTCQAHWSDTWTLLQSGAFKDLLARLGRIDLIQAVTEAVADTDPDHGVDFFVSRLPANNLTPARLRVAPAQRDLGALKCGEDLGFDVHLSNDGHRLIVGHVRSDCPWLEVEGATTDRPRLLQFVKEQNVRVRVVGAQLPASQRPRAGKLIVRTNAGDADVAVSCTVPVVPFPEGVLKGSDTPRELAKHARRALQEAAPLFTAGTVQAWYRANGWTYPVEGSPATGKAAVQQFFEALGLTTPPCVVLDTANLVIEGAAGERVRRTVRVHTDDKRPIFAFGRSLSPWLSVVDSDTHGNVAHVTVEANIPASSAGRLETQLEVRANGNQRFRVPIVLHILDDVAVEVIEVTAPKARAVPRNTASGCMRAVVAASMLGWICFFAAGVLLFFMMSASAAHAPLKPYAAAISARTCAGLEVDLSALEATTGLENDVARLQAKIGPWLQDLNLTPKDVRLRRLFTAVSADGRPLTVWTFNTPVQITKIANDRYLIDDAKLRVDRFDLALAWAVDGQGRLLRGTPADVRAALEREKTGQTSGAYEPLAQAATGMAPGTIAWAVGDLRNGGAEALAGLLGEDSLPAISRFNLELLREPSKGFVLRGRGVFAASRDAELCRDWLRGLPTGANSLLGALEFKRLLDGAVWDARGVDLHMTASLAPERPRSALVLAAAKLEESRQAKQAIADKQQYKDWLDSARDALRLGKLAEARTFTEKLKKLTFKDLLRDTLEKDLATAERRSTVDAELEAARKLVKREEIAKVREHFQRARDIEPANEQAKQGFVAANQLQEIDDALDRARKQLGNKLPDSAHRVAMQALAPLLGNAGSGAWRDEPFKTHRARFLLEGALVCRRVFDDSTAAAAAAQLKAEQALGEKRLAQAVTEYDEAMASLNRAKAILNDFRDLGSPALPGAKQLDAQIDSLTQASAAARNMNLVAEGSAVLKDARAKLESAAANPANVSNILTNLDKALKSFDEAEKLQKGSANLLIREAKELQTQFGRVLHPIKLDPRKGLVDEDWPNRAKNAWTEGVVGGGWCLQSTQAKPVALTCAERPWPTEFVLRMDFAFLDAKKTAIDNRLWADHHEPLALVLLGADGSNTTIALGGETNNKVPWAAKLRVNNNMKPMNTGKDLDSKNDNKIHLVLRCAKSGAAGKKLVSVSIKDKLIDTAEIASDVVALKLWLANPARDGKASAFVAIFRLDVSWTGADMGAAPLR